MQQLTALDVMFSSLDTETTNGVLGGLVLHDPPPPGVRNPDAAFMRARIAERLAYLPPLHRVVAQVPLGLDHDYLAQAGRIDLHEHVREIRLPEPGTHEQLAAEVSMIMSSDLPMDRPLWDYTVIHGLQDGSVAHLLRIHHLVIDGGSMPVLWDALADEPTRPLTAAYQVRHAEPRFGALEMLAREARGVFAKPAQWGAFQARYAAWLVATLRSGGPAAVAALPFRMLPEPLARPGQALLNGALRGRGVAEIEPYLPTLRAPGTPFNNRVSAQRTFAFAELPLAPLRESGKALGGTVNDAVLAVCAGAVRRYLRERGAAVAEPLVVCVPVSIRAEGETLQWANFVHMIFARFPTHLDDPAERIRFARSAIRRSKGSFEALPTDLVRDASRFVPSAMFDLATRLMVKLPDAASRAPWNVVVSNVRGPSEPADVGGVRVRGYFPASFLSVGGGLNITLQSYTDRVCFGLMGAPEQVGDLAPLVQYLSDALAETVAATRAVPESGSRDRSSRSRPPAPARVTALPTRAARRGR